MARWSWCFNRRRSCGKEGPLISFADVTSTGVANEELLWTERDTDYSIRGQQVMTTLTLNRCFWLLNVVLRSLSRALPRLRLRGSGES
jgi:hypothetical protein